MRGSRDKNVDFSYAQKKKEEITLRSRIKMIHTNWCCIIDDENRLFLPLSLSFFPSSFSSFPRLLLKWYRFSLLLREEGICNDQRTRENRLRRRRCRHGREPRRTFETLLHRYIYTRPYIHVYIKSWKCGMHNVALNYEVR